MPCEKLQLSNSQLSVARECPRKYQFQYINQRIPIATSHALVFGRLWHEVLERWWMTGPESAVAYLVDQADKIEPSDAAMLAAMLTHYRPPVERFEVVAVEQELVVPIVNPETGRAMRDIEMVLRYDALVTDRQTGKRWLIEHKSSGDEIVGFGPFWQRLSLDQQISIYLLATGAEGVCYDVARKPRLKMCGKDEQAAIAAGILVSDAYQKRLEAEIVAAPDSYYQFREIRKTQSDLVEAQWDIYHQALILREQRKRGLFPRNPSACRSLYGTCPYLEVCVGSALLDDDALFEDRRRAA